jgi:hypothetical protein
VAHPFNCKFAGFLCGPLLAAATVAACNSRTPPAPQSREQEATEAQREAASVETEMNKDAESEDIAKKPGEPASQ